MRVAVIIPTANEESALARSLTRLTRMTPAPDELIVVDGAARSSCARTCRAAGAHWIAARAARGGLLALGAAHARAEVLWFLPTDCEPAPQALRAIHDCVAAGAVGGYFRLRFAGARGPAERLLERCIAWRSRYGTVYGEHALFVTRAAYAETPGFSLQPLFEQVALVRALKHTHRFVALSLPITVAAVSRGGCLRHALLNRLLVLGFACGMQPARLARWPGTRARHVPGHGGGQPRSGDPRVHKG
jgi:hypothetical protein